MEGELLKLINDYPKVVKWNDVVDFDCFDERLSAIDCLVINTIGVCDGEIEFIDRLSGDYKFNWLIDNRDSSKTIGYVAYMKLRNGFEKSLYMSIQDLKSHGVKYSQTFKKGFGLTPPALLTSISMRPNWSLAFSIVFRNCSVSQTSVGMAKAVRPSS